MGTPFIAIDAMGGDFAPSVTVRGCVAALDERDGFGAILVGRREALEAELSACSPKADYVAGGRLIIKHASEIVLNEDSPIAAIKEKKDSSMAVALRLVKEGAAQAAVSAGNTGALLTGGLQVVGRVKGVLRPALGVMLPGLNASGFGYTLLIDAGANMDAKPAFLAQFARMGAIYAESVLGVNSPRVGLVNVGAEKEKGNALTKETYGLLESSGLNFTGNLEARGIPLGGADVAVCDAFVGNIILKHSEGLSKALLSIIKDELMSGLLSKAGAVLSKNAFANVKKRFDAGEVGGAPFLGLEGLLVKAHGNSDAKAVKNAVFQAVAFAEKGTLEKLRASMAGAGDED